MLSLIHTFTIFPSMDIRRFLGSFKASAIGVNLIVGKTGRTGSGKFCFIERYHEPYQANSNVIEAQLV